LTQLNWRILLLKSAIEVCLAMFFVTVGLSLLTFPDNFLPWPVNDGLYVRVMASFGLIFMFFTLFGYAVSYALLIFLTNHSTLKSRVFWRTFGLLMHISLVGFLVFPSDGDLIFLFTMLAGCGATSIFLAEFLFHSWKKAS